MAIFNSPNKRKTSTKMLNARVHLKTGRVLSVKFHPEGDHANWNTKDLSETTIHRFTIGNWWTGKSSVLVLGSSIDFVEVDN